MPPIASAVWSQLGAWRRWWLCRFALQWGVGDDWSAFSTRWSNYSCRSLPTRRYSYLCFNFMMDGVATCFRLSVATIGHFCPTRLLEPITPDTSKTEMG